MYKIRLLFIILILCSPFNLTATYNTRSHAKLQ